MIKFDNEMDNEAFQHYVQEAEKELVRNVEFNCTIINRIGISYFLKFDNSHKRYVEGLARGLSLMTNTDYHISYDYGMVRISKGDTYIFSKMY